MIKVEHTSEQELSKDDFIVNGKYSQGVKFCGIKIWHRTSEVKNILNDNNFKRADNSVGFGKK